MPYEKEKVKRIFIQIVEPFALGVLTLLFIIPIITVMNLTPLTKEIKKLDVLGVTNKDEVIVTLVEGKHEIFTSESLNKLEDLNFTYSVTLNKRTSDSYSKPILEIDNRSDKEKEITFVGQTLSNTKSNIFLIVNNQTYKIQSSSGEPFTIELNIPSKEKFIVFLGLENLSGVQFSQIFDMDISIIDALLEE
jgi:hypothetical protein